MAMFALDKAAIASCSSFSGTFHERFPEGYGDCSCSGSGWGSRRARAVVCGLQLGSKSGFSASSSSAASCPSDGFARGFSGGSVVRRLRQNGTSREMEVGRGRRGRGNGVVTMALPIDTYWITAAQALAVAFLMGGSAVLAGILINIKIEVEALAEFKELEAKGLLPDEFNVPEGEFDLESPLYILQKKELSSSNSPSRNRPIRDEFEPQLETEMKAELEIAAKE